LLAFSRDHRDPELDATTGPANACVRPITLGSLGSLGAFRCDDSSQRCIRVHPVAPMPVSYSIAKESDDAT
jgi:hypothetical protein